MSLPPPGDQFAIEGGIRASGFGARDETNIGYELAIAKFSRFEASACMTAEGELAIERRRLTTPIHLFAYNVRRKSVAKSSRIRSRAGIE